MSLRLTAAVAVALIAMALVAAYLSAQRPTTSFVPGGSVGAYQSLIQKDNDAVESSTSVTECLKFGDPTCGPATARLAKAVQQFATDLQAFNTPRRFKAVDGQLRLVLTLVIGQADAASAAIAANDQNAFNAAWAGLDFGTWVRRITTAIVGSKVASPADYKFLLREAQLSLEACAACQDLAGPGFFSLSGCAGPNTDQCVGDVNAVFVQIGQVLAALVQTASPAQYADKDAKLQADLATANAALLGMGTALRKPDFAALGAKRTNYVNALPAIDSDIAAILQS